MWSSMGLLLLSMAWGEHPAEGPLFTRTTEHFAVHATDPELAEVVAEMVEPLWHSLCGPLSFWPRGRLDVVVGLGPTDTAGVYVDADRITGGPSLLERVALAVGAELFVRRTGRRSPGLDLGLWVDAPLLGFGGEGAFGIDPRPRQWRVALAAADLARRAGASHLDAGEVRTVRVLRQNGELSWTNWLETPNAPVAEAFAGWLAVEHQLDVVALLRDPGWNERVWDATAKTFTELFEDWKLTLSPVPVVDGKHEDGPNGPPMNPMRTRVAVTVGRPGGSDLQIIEVATGHRETIGPSGVDTWAREPSWSVDGSEIAYSLERHGVVDLYVWSTTENRLRALNRDRWEDRSPNWAPDGSLFFLSNPGGNGFDLMRLDAAQSRVERWTDDGSVTGLRVVGTLPWISRGAGWSVFEAPDSVDDVTSWYGLGPRSEEVDQHLARHVRESREMGVNSPWRVVVAPGLQVVVSPWVEPGVVGSLRLRMSDGGERHRVGVVGAMGALSQMTLVYRWKSSGTQVMTRGIWQGGRRFVTADSEQHWLGSVSVRHEVIRGWEVVTVGEVVGSHYGGVERLASARWGGISGVVIGPVAISAGWWHGESRFTDLTMTEHYAWNRYELDAGLAMGPSHHGGWELRADLGARVLDGPVHADERMYVGGMGGPSPGLPPALNTVPFPAVPVGAVAADGVVRLAVGCTVPLGKSFSSGAGVVGIRGFGLRPGVDVLGIWNIEENGDIGGFGWLVDVDLALEVRTRWWEMQVPVRIGVAWAPHLDLPTTSIAGSDERSVDIDALPPWRVRFEFGRWSRAREKTR